MTHAVIHVNELTRSPRIGCLYHVDCIKTVGWVNGRFPETIHLPIIGLPHADPGVKTHVHIDQRFLTNKELIEHSSVIRFMWPGDEVEVRTMVCRRAKFRNFGVLAGVQQEYAGAAIVKGRCPHRGAYIGNLPLVRDGCLVCPLHGLFFDRKTGTACPKRPGFQ